MRQIENSGLASFDKDWRQVKRQLKTAIGAAILQDFSTGKWDKISASQRGTFIRIEHEAKRILEEMHKQYIPALQNFIRGARFSEMLRTVWILRQTLPPCVPIRVPIGHHVHTEVKRESAGGQGDGEDLKKIWTAWSDAYVSNLVHNIGLGALHEGSVTDAVDEVDATKVGSPSMDMWDVGKRIFATSFAAATFGDGGGHDDAMDANPDAPSEEIFQTRFDSNVCPICIAYDGMRREDVDDEIPVHPSCRCAWMVKPEGWSDAGGDTDDSASPTDMIIKDADGNPQAAVIVSFEDWITANLSHIISARKAVGLM